MEKDFKEICKKYNEVRKSFVGYELSKKEICELISFIPNGVINNFTTVQKYGLVDKVKTGKYKFPNDPVYWEAVKNCSEAMRQLNKKYTDRYMKKKKSKTSKSSKASSLTEEDMLAYLKSTGKYRILRKKVEWEEV